MYLAIASDGLTLHQPEVTTDLYASFWERLSAIQIGTALADDDAGEMLPDGAHVMLRVDALRRLAAGRVPDGWDADFDAMLSKARDHGWLSEDGESVRAHLERLR